MTDPNSYFTLSIWPLEHLVSLGFVQTCLQQAALTPATTTHIWLFWMTGILLSIDPKHYTYRNWQPCQKEQHEQTKPLKRFSCSLCLYLFVFFKADEDNSLSFYPLLCLLARATVTAHLSQLFQLKCRRSRFLYGYYSVEPSKTNLHAGCMRM